MELRRVAGELVVRRPDEEVNLVERLGRETASCRTVAHNVRVVVVIARLPRIPASVLERVQDPERKPPTPPGKLDLPHR